MKRSFVVFAVAAGLTVSTVLFPTSSLADSRDRNISDPVIGSENGALSYAPDVPPPITRNHATKVVIAVTMVGGVKRLLKKERQKPAPTR